MTTAGASSQEQRFIVLTCSVATLLFSDHLLARACWRAAPLSMRGFEQKCSLLWSSLAFCCRSAVRSTSKGRAVYQDNIVCVKSMRTEASQELEGIARCNRVSFQQGCSSLQIRCRRYSAWILHSLEQPIYDQLFCNLFEIQMGMHQRGAVISTASYCVACWANRERVCRNVLSFRELAREMRADSVVVFSAGAV